MTDVAGWVLDVGPGSERSAMARRRTSSPVTHEDIGRFVRCPEVGIGRLTSLDRGQAQVRYFKGPSRSPYVDLEHPADALALTQLHKHTRVYLHDGHRWRIGRIDDDNAADESTYVVAFPNRQGRLLPPEAFDVRWDKPIDDPYEILETIGGDSPLVYEARLSFLAEWSRQKAVSQGVEGLLLGSVELHKHQLQVVRRAALDPVQRYLLADEVGLGKTIEAGALLAQFLRRRPQASILVLTPDHLREQWANELLTRFHTAQYADASIWIRSYEDDRTPKDQEIDLLVIDEAHHITRSGTASDKACRRITAMAQQANALLLLSATPVRSNEAGFLDLLSMLDPENYQAKELDAFVRRVELREQLALTCQALVPDIDEFDLSLYTEQLAGMFPADKTLAALLSDATEADDDDRAAAVNRVREHLSETYRLHHRLLRTRRTPDLGASFSIRGRKQAVPFIQQVDDPSDEARAQLLDTARVHLVAGVESGSLDMDTAITVFRELAQRCGSLSHTLLPLVDPTGTLAADPTLSAIQELITAGVLPLSPQLIDQIHSGHEELVSQFIDAIATTVVRGNRRTVVASSYTEAAVAVSAEMRRRWGNDRVATHLRVTAHAQNRSELARWEGTGPCTVLVVDAGAEEGINLQIADLLIHLDLPWNAFRVEQRVGRCDRHAPVGIGPVPSMVTLFGDQRYAMGWLEYLSDACGVFTRSISSLQYVLSDTEHRVLRRALTEGDEALSAAAVEEVDALAAERIKIAAYDALDSVSVTTDAGGRQSTERLLESDKRTALGSALLSWLQGVGAGVAWPTNGVLRIQQRPRPQVPFDLEVALARSMEVDLTLDRSVAVERGVPLLRAGHPFVDAVAHHLRHDDRGVTFAFLRPAANQWPPLAFMRTDFLVSAAPDSTLLGEADRLGLRVWLEQLIQEVFPPLVETTMCSPNGDEAQHPALGHPYDKSRGDRNLVSRPDDFGILAAHMDWSRLCETALTAARSVIANRPILQRAPAEAATQLRQRVLHRLDREQARATAGMEANPDAYRRLESRLPEYLEPQIDVLGCGVIFVADPRKRE